jgi:hypothetical protein
MSDSGGRKNKVQRFLEKNPYCCFCGGVREATTVDHVPPRACFPDGFAPEGFEFPACKDCNEGSVKQDQIFGLYAILLDFDEAKMGRPADWAKLEKLKQGILNNYPDALPDESTAQPIFRAGVIHTITPKAILIQTTPALKEATGVIGQKLAHALYLRETGKMMTAEHRFLTGAFQPQRQGTEVLSSYFNSLLPQESIGSRPNIREYGDRFKYLSGYKDKEDFFVFAAQFGRGLILWGIVGGKSVLLPTTGPLAAAPWLRGACGKGSLIEGTTPRE